MTGAFPFRYYPPKNRIRTSSKIAQIPTMADSPPAMIVIRSTSFLKAYKKSQKGVGFLPSSQIFYQGKVTSATKREENRNSAYLA